MPDWLELELAERLAPTEAPDALWTAVERGRATPPMRAPRPKWPVAAIVTIMVAAGALWMVAKGQEPALDLHRLAALETNAAETLGLRSSDPAEVAAWLQKESGVKVRLSPATGIHLVGAKVVGQRGASVAVVSFTVKERPQALLLARGAAPSHAGVEWALAGVGTSDHELACLLCHSSL